MYTYSVKQLTPRRVAKKIDCNRTSRSIFQYIVNPTKSSTTQRSTSAPLSTGFDFHQIPNAETVKSYLQERKGWKDLKVVQNQGNIPLSKSRKGTI